MFAYLDIAIADGEENEERNEADDDAGDGEHDTSLDPVESQNTRAVVDACRAAGRARQAREGRVVQTRLPLATDTP